MKSILRFLWVLPVLALGSGLVYQGIAQELLAPARGSVLILKNESTLEGEIQRKGRIYLIHKNGGEQEVSGEIVLRLCQGWDDAVKFMRSQANLHDPDERIRLARWCSVNQLPEYAQEEAEQALKMRPQDSEVKYLVLALQRQIEKKHQQVTDVAPPKAPSPVPQIDISQESMVAFQNKTQIILINSCGRCHSGDKGGDFQLQLLHDSGERTATQRNLATVLRQINFEHPKMSPLLYKANSLHGGQTQAAIRAQNSVQYQMLQRWVEELIANNPHLRGTDSFVEKKTTVTPQSPKTNTSFARPPAFSDHTGTVRNSLLVDPAPSVAADAGGFGMNGPIVSSNAAAITKTIGLDSSRSAYTPPFSMGDKKPTGNAGQAFEPDAKVGLERPTYVQPPMPRLPENAVGAPAPLGAKKSFPHKTPAFPALAAEPSNVAGAAPPPTNLTSPAVIQSPPAMTMAPQLTAAPGPSPPGPVPRSDEYDPSGFNGKLPR